MPTPPKVASTPRRRRWLRRVLLTLALLLVVSLGALAWVGTHLETPWLRAQIRQQVAHTLHVDIDYGAASVGVRGIDLRDFRVASMLPDQDLAPDLLRVGHVKVHWRIRDLVRGGIRLHELAVDDVTLNVVRDAAGVTSLERLLAALPPSPPEPTTPWSQLLRKLQHAPVVAVPELHVRGVRLAVWQRQDGPPARWTLGDLGLDAHVQTGLAWPTLEATVTGQPLILTQDHAMLPAEVTPLVAQVPVLAALTTHGSVEMTLKTVLTLVKPDELALTTTLATPQAPLVTLDLGLVARQSGVDVRVRQLALGTVATLQMDVAVPDAGVGPTLATVRTWTAGLDLAALTVAGTDVRGLSAHLRGQQLVVPRAGGQPTIADMTADLALATLHHPMATVHGLKLTMHAQAPADRPSAQTTLHVDGLNVADLAHAATVTGLDAQTSVVADAQGVTLTVAGDVALALADAVTAETVHAGVQVEAAPWQTWLDAPWTAVRTLQAQLTVGVLRATQQAQTVTAHGIEAGVTLPPVTRDPATGVVDVVHPIDAHMSADRVEAPGVDVRHAAATARVDHVHVDPVEPRTALAHAVLDAKLGATTAHAEIHKRADALEWRAHWTLPNLRELTAMLPVPPPLRRQVNWATLTIDGHSAGQVTHLTAQTEVHADTQLALHQLAWQDGARKVAMAGLTLSVQNRGHGLTQQATLAVDMDGLHVGRVRQALLQLAGKLDVDPDARHADGQWTLQGAYGLHTQGHLNVQHTGTAWHYAVDMDARGLAGLLRGWPLAERQALCLGEAGLAVTLTARGQLAWPGPLGGRHHVVLGLERVACRVPQGSVEWNRLDLTLDAEGQAHAWRADVTVALPVLDLAGGGHVAHVEGLTQHLIGQLAADGAMRLTLDARLKRMTQDAVAGWTARDVTLEVAGWADAEAMRVEKFVLDNPGSGTHLDLAGGLDRTALHPPRVTDADLAGEAAAATTTTALDGAEPVPGHQGLELAGTLRQDLGAWAKGNDKVTASGVVSLPFRVESGDLVLYRATARMHLEHVSVGLPALGLAVTDIHGDLPTAESFRMQPTFALLGGGEDNAYTRWRFADHQPFLRRDDFLTIGHIQFHDTILGPVAGNAGLDRDVFRLEQLEAALLGGKLTGQCIVRLRGADTWVLVRGTATGLRVSGSDEELDANAALEWLPVRASLDGRAELLHVGRRHLEALLDLWDPYGEDAQSNRLRSVLRLGHPEHVRMRFEHGFMDIAVALGGLGSAVQIDELRGIALGPLFQRWVDPLVAPWRSALGKEGGQ